ncbi:MAG: hypothetical protein KAJ73_09700, partial [Zetaproteobacteria bacterium]|nr:hypothetical protein [Zetaproteobacteria bacterium]
MDYSRYLPWSPRGLSWRSTNLNDFTYVDAGRFSEVTAFGYNEFSDTEKAVGGLNDDDMDYWRNAAEALRAEALEFSSPVQDVMRDVVMQARQWSGDVGLELPLGAEEGDIFSEYGDIWKKAGVSPPQTVGEVQNYLVRSMYPSFFEFAGKKAGYGGGFFEAFSDVSSSYIEGLGKWEPTTQPEVIRGARTSYYGAQELQRAYEQTGAPKGSFGYDDAINYRTMLGGVSENMYARGGYVSPEYDAMQAVDRYVRNRSLPAKGQWHGSGKNRYFEPTHDLYGQGQTATYEYDGETRQRLPYQLGNKSYKDVIYGQSYKPSPRAVSAQNVVTAMYTAGSFTEMAKQLPQQFLRNPTQMSHQYMGGDANIFGYGTMWGGWEESHQSREYELTHPRASRAFSVDVPAMPVVGQGGFKPGGVGGIETLSYSLPNSYYDLASEARGGRRNFLGLYQAGPEAGLGVSYTHANPPLLESPYHKPYYDVLKDISTGMGEKGMNWEYQQAIVRSQTEAGRIPGDIIGTTRGKRFDQGYDIGTQAGYASKGRAPTFTDLYPNSSVGSPQYLSAGGAVKERWSPKEYNFGLSNRKLEDAYYRERVMQGKHQLPPNVGFAYGTTSQGEYIDTSFTETFGHQGGPSAGGFQRIIPQDPTMNMPATQGQTPLLGSGRSGLLLPPPGSDDFVRQMPARQAGAGMPFAMGRGTSATHADSWYAGDQMYNEPMVSDRAQLEMAQRDVVQQTSLQGNPIMTMPLLPPGGRGRSEEIIPGENQYYEDRGASQHPSATPISRGTPLLPASTGNRESQFYGSSSAPFPSEYARDRMGPIELGARAGALGGREQLSSSTAIVPISGRFTRSENLGVPDMSDTLYGDDPGSSSTAQRHYQSPGVQGVLDSLRAGRSAMGSLRPGYGKTEAIVGAAHIGGPNAPGGGVSLSMSPLTSLNQQTTAALNKRGIRAFNLIGHPGEGEDDTAWAKVNKEFRDAVTESIDPKTGEWIKGKSPVVGVMSFEKYGALDRSRGLGKALVGLHDRGLMGPTTVDEAQEIGRGGRLMIKKIADVAKGMFPGSPTSLLGGTINRSQESMLQNLFGIGDEDIQRAPASMKHLDVSLEAVKQSDYEATGGRFAREARGGQLQYGYSTKLVDKLQIASQQEGREAFRYHKGFGSSGELMTPEELGKVEKLVEGGLTKNQTIAASPALGLGMNIKGTESVTQIGAARPSDIIQRALRIRPERLPSGEQDLTKNVGEFRMAVDPKQYE